MALPLIPIVIGAIVCGAPLAIRAYKAYKAANQVAKPLAKGAQLAKKVSAAQKAQQARTGFSKTKKGCKQGCPKGKQTRARRDKTPKKFYRSKAERRKALLRDARDPKSGLTRQQREFIIKNNGERVPKNLEVSHEVPLKVGKTIDEKKALDVADNMKTQLKTVHRARHRLCGDQYHQFGP